MDREIKEEFRELARLLNPPALEQIKSKMSSLYNRADELSRSRDNWKRKFFELKKKLREEKE